LIEACGLNVGGEFLYSMTSKLNYAMKEYEMKINIKQMKVMVISKKTC